MPHPAPPHPDALPGLARHLFDTLPEPALLLDSAFHVVRVNPAFAGRLGLSPTQMEYRPLADLGARLPLLAWLAETLQDAFGAADGLEAFEATADGLPPLPGPLRVEVQRCGGDGENRPLILARLTPAADPRPPRKGPDQGLGDHPELIESIMDAVGLADLDGRLLRSNRAFRELVGYTEAELRSITFWDLTPPQWHELQKRIMAEQVMVRGYSDVFQKEYRRKDGRTVPIELRVIQTRDPGGRPTGTWAIVRDITERVEAEENLQRFRYAIDNAREAVFWLDREGRFPYVNEQACRSLGYSRDELCRLHLWDIDPHFSPARWGPQWEMMRRVGHRIFKTHHRRKDGTVFPIEVSSNHILYGDREHHVAFVRDISEQQQREEALQFFQEAMDAASDAIFWMNEAAGFLYANDQACRSLGYSREELLRLHLWDIDPTFPPERWQAHWDEMRTVGKRLIETVHKRKDGTLFPIEVSVYRIPHGEEERHIAFVRDITARKKADEALKRSEERYRQLFDGNPQPVWVYDLETLAFLAVNRAAIATYGYSEAEFRGMTITDLGPPEEEGRLKEDVARAAAGLDRAGICRHRLKDGALIDVETVAHPITFEGRRSVIILVNDVTARLLEERERSKLEAQLRQAQKMESIGRLAGGVAHDFNNMLSVITGYAELMQTKLPASHAAQKDLEQIKRAAGRSRDLTRQLLAFSRKQIIEPQVLNPNRLIHSLERAIARLIGEHIEQEWRPAPEVWPIRFDPAQLEQILVNLAVNARDAMPGGGKLVIETANVRLDEAYCREHAGFRPGEFVQIAVSDRGCGIDERVLPYIFEPFFTTKPKGEGTGLGLAMVYGIVKQGGGFINVYSEPGRGTTFRIYIPRHMGAAAPAPEIPERPLEPGAGTILLVEDDAMVRGITAAMLEKIGYRVLVAESPEQALAMAQDGGTAIDLLVTDVVMPRMNGRELHTALAAIRPGLKALFMSGYTANVIVHHGVLEAGVHFLPKPFSLAEVAGKVKEALRAVQPPLEGQR